MTTVAIQDTDADAPGDPRRRRRWPIILIVGVLLAAAAGTAITISVLQSTSADDTSSSTSPAATAAVEKRTVTAQSQVNGTLGYAGGFHVTGQLPGTVTQIPAVGTVIDPGQVLYRVNGAPVILLRGPAPAWRAFEWGTTGVDAQQLNAALVALGYTDGLDLDPKSDTITWRSQQAIKNLQAAFGLSKTGVLDFGQVVFLPEPLRVTEVLASLGSTIGPGQTVLTGTSTIPQVNAAIPVSVAQRIEVGDAVTITLPDQSTAEGTVESVGTVATKPDGGGSATIPVTITLTDPDSAAGLDQAPVSVAITTATVEDAIVVPVTALLAQAGSGYAVEVADDDGTHIVPVDLGLFDSAGGVVQITSDGLEPGQRVVVPAP